MSIHSCEISTLHFLIRRGIGDSMSSRSEIDDQTTLRDRFSESRVKGALWKIEEHGDDEDICHDNAVSTVKMEVGL